MPIYTWQDSTTRGFSTLLGDIVRWRPERPTLDPLTHAMWLGGHMGKPDQRSLLAGVKVLARGHACAFAPKTPPRVLRYWDPRQHADVRARGRVADNVAAAFRETLVATLDRELEPNLDSDGHARNLGALSGGVDSSALVSVARTRLGRHVSTFSVVPPSAPHRARELAYIGRIAPRPPAEQTLHIPNTSALRIAHTRAAPPLASYRLGATAFLQDVCRGRRFRVLFGGVGADELCGSAITRLDWLRTMPAQRLFWLRELPTGRSDVRQWLTAALRSAGHKKPTIQLPYRPQLPGYIASEIGAEYEEWFERYVRDYVTDESPHATMHRYVERDEFNAVGWEAASALGMRNLHPFMTRSLIELGYAVHPDDVIGPGTKRLLRRALAGRVPTANLYRSDKDTQPNTKNSHLWSRRVPDALESLVRPEWFPHPPARIDNWDALGLWRAVRFHDSLNELRRETEHSGAERPQGVHEHPGVAHPEVEPVI